MKDFKGNLGNYKIIETEDQTITLWSEYFNEACHNLSGAYEETLYNYIQGTELPLLFSKSEPVSILDVGFGLGLGLKAVIDHINQSDIFYYSIELDEVLVEWALKTNFPAFTFVRKIDKELITYEGRFIIASKNITIFIFIGDGRKTLPAANLLNLIHPLDAIFQDAFSPRKNPALWSVEWFDFLKNISKKTVRLSTYSSSVSIRKSLVKAGWAIKEAQGFGKKKFMSLAGLQGESSPELLERLLRSPSLEIRD